MKKLILSISFVGTLMIAASACNSTKNVSDTTDSTTVDTSMMPVDTTRIVDTTMSMPPDTTVKPM